MTDELVGEAIRQLLSPHGGGGGGHERDRRRAEQVLLEHPIDAHAELLALLEDPPPGAALSAILDVLPRFGNPASIPALARLLRDPSEPVALGAARALARHPSPEALEALRAARSDAPAAAAYGLELRG